MAGEYIQTIKIYYHSATVKLLDYLKVLFYLKKSLRFIKELQGNTEKYIQNKHFEKQLEQFQNNYENT